MYGLLCGYELDRYRVQVGQGWVNGTGRTPVGIFGTSPMPEVSLGVGHFRMLGA